MQLLRQGIEDGDSKFDPKLGAARRESSNKGMLLMCNLVPMRRIGTNGKPLEGADLCGQESWNSADWHGRDEHVKVGQGVKGGLSCCKCLDNFSDCHASHGHNFRFSHPVDGAVEGRGR
jgi:hypothetical protein